MGGVLGPKYEGNVFELDPLVVRKGRQDKGIDRVRVGALEEEASNRGSLTI